MEARPIYALKAAQISQNWLKIIEKLLRNYAKIA